MSSEAVEYRCVACGRKLLEASEPISGEVTSDCRSCGEVRKAEPSGEVMHRTYRCTNEGCEVSMHAERATPDWTFCAACGTETLEVVEEIRRPQRVEARVRTA